MADYDIRRAFEKIENELIASMIRNMERHRDWEDDEGFQWEQWQALQLKNLEEYKRQNQKKFGKEFGEINKHLEDAIMKARRTGNMEQELELLEMVKTGKFKKPRATKKSANTNAEFFKLNDRKMDALIKATVSDMEKAETAILRMANDKYRKVIFDAQVYANSGAGTYEKAIDMATRDLRAAGLNCVEYKNGARHTLKDYAEMALKTATKRAYLTGEGEKRKEWGISTVIMNKRGNPCPLCLPFVGKVMIDDVWSGGSSKDGKYMLMSTAISKGLYHPRCKDSHSTYFEGISTPPDDKFTKKEIKEIEEENKAEAKKQNAQRQAEKFERLAKYSLDKDNKSKYQLKVAEWQGEIKEIAPDEDELNMIALVNEFSEKLISDPMASTHKQNMGVYARITTFKKDLKQKSPFLYDGKQDEILFNPSLDIEMYDMDYILSHELSHRMDVNLYGSWENEGFLKAIDSCSELVYTNKKEIQEWFNPGGKYEWNPAMSDIMSALFKGDFDAKFMHDKEYWERDKSTVPAEIFANLSSIDVLGEFEEPILADLFKAYRKMVE